MTGLPKKTETEFSLYGNKPKPTKKVNLENVTILTPSVILPETLKQVAKYFVQV